MRPHFSIALRRLILLLVAGAIILGGNTAQAQFTSSPNGDGTCTVTGYAGSGGAVSIPNEIDGLPVTSIDDDAFDDANFASVTIPEGVTSIGDGAFFNCASLTSITIPASVIFIGNQAFALCSSLPAINVDSSNPAYSSVAGVLFDKSQATLVEYPGGIIGSYTIPASVTSIGSQAFGHCTNLTSVTIPNSVTSIGDQAFDECFSLASVTIGDNVSSLGFWAFSNCDDLTSIAIPASVVNIGDGAFINCTSLTSIDVDPSNPDYRSVDGVLFDHSQATLIEYPGGATGIYTIPNSVTSIEDYAFASCYSLTSITMGNSVTSIGDLAFWSCSNLASVTMPASVTSIGAGAFNSCTALTSVKIPASVTSIGDEAFMSCSSLTAINVDPGNPGYSSVKGVLFNRIQTTLVEFPSGLGGGYTIPQSVTDIGGNAFVGASALTSVTIPADVTSIEDDAFYYCMSLSSIYFQGNAPSADSTAFDSDTNVTVYYLPGTSGWGATFAGFPTVIENPPNPAGSLHVTITPDDANTAGAYWQVDGGIPQPSGATVLGLTVGSHTISFGAVGGWVAPPNQTISVSADATATASGAYEQFQFFSEPNDISVLLGESAYFSADASTQNNDTLTYQWQISTDGGKTWGNLTNGGSYGDVTTPNLNINNATLAMSGDQFQVIVYDASASTSLTSSPATLTVATQAPVISNQPDNQNVAAGVVANFVAEVAAGPAPTYQWQISTDGGTTWSNLTDGNSIAGSTLPVLNINNPTAAISGEQFRYIATNNLGSITSQAATLTVTAQDALDDWTWRTPLPQGNNLSAAAYGNGLFVAVGENGTVMTSPDGETWTIRDSGTTGYLAGITWSGTQFVAVGNDSGGTNFYYNGGDSASAIVLTSPDGITWTNRDLGASGVLNALNGVIWSGTQFVAVGCNDGTGNAAILTSPDGVNWTAQSFSGVGGVLQSVTWSGTQFVAVGYDFNTDDDTSSAVILTSPDGVAWTSQSSSLDGGLDGVTWNGAQFVAVGFDVNTGGAILASTDGVNWTRQNSGANPYPGLGSVIWTGTQFVAVGGSVVAEEFTFFGENVPIANSTILTSTDGVIWTSREASLGSNGNLAGVAWSGAQFVAVGSSGVIATSSDGATWTSLNSDTFGNANSGAVMGDLIVRDFKSLAWNGAQFVAVGGGEDNDYTTNGLSLTQGVLIQTSPDGMTWSSQVIYNDEAYLNAITWNGTQFVAAGEGVTQTSSDGLNWTANMHYFLNAITWGGTRFVAVGDNTILTSPDGVNWTSQNSGTSDPIDLSAITWSGTQFVAVGSDENTNDGAIILTSPDGVNWTSHDPGASDNISLNAITWSGTNFVAVGQDGDTGNAVILTSPDGVTWTSQDPDGGASNSLNAITWTGTQFAAVGGYNRIQYGNSYGDLLTSPDGVTWTRRNISPGPNYVGIIWTGTQLFVLGENGEILSATLASVPSISIPPVSAAVVAGANASFTVAALGTPAPSFQWQVSTDGGSTWNNVSGGTYAGATAATLGITNPATAFSGYEYRALVTNGAGTIDTPPVSLVVGTSTAKLTWLQNNFTSAQLGQPGIVGDLASPAGDGIPNLIKYAFNLDALANGRSLLPKSTVGNGQVVLTFPASPPDLAYTVEASTDLVHWSASGVTVQTNGGQLAASYSIPSGNAAFLRLVIGVSP